MSRRGRDMVLVGGEPVNLSRPVMADGNTEVSRSAIRDFMESGQCGSFVDLPVNFNQYKTCVKIVTEDRKSIPITVSLSGALQNYSLLADASQSIDCKVLWGAGGNFAEAELDFIKGCTFTLVCSSIEVFLKNNSALSSFKGGVFLSKGAKGSAQVPQKTLSVTVAAAANDGVTIPEFAKTFSVERANIGVATNVNLLNGALGVVAQHVIGVNQDSPKYVIPNNSQSVQLNHTGGVSVAHRVVFDLAL